MLLKVSTNIFREIITNKRRTDSSREFTATVSSSFESGGRCRSKEEPFLESPGTSRLASKPFAHVSWPSVSPNGAEHKKPGVPSILFARRSSGSGTRDVMDRSSFGTAFRRREVGLLLGSPLKGGGCSGSEPKPASKRSGTHSHLSWSFLRDPSRLGKQEQDILSLTCQQADAEVVSAFAQQCVKMVSLTLYMSNETQAASSKRTSRERASHPTAESAGDVGWLCASQI